MSTRYTSVNLHTLYSLLSHTHTHTHTHKQTQGMTFETIGTLLGIGVYALFFGALASGSGHSCATGVRIPSLGEVSMSYFY